MWRWDQGEPFGNDEPNNNPSGAGAFDFPLRFPGQYFDRETNLAYNWMRDYDSKIGRYVEADPIGLRGDSNVYAYVGSNPMSRIDPQGLITAKITCPPPPSGYVFKDKDITLVPRINCIMMTDPVTGRHDLFCDVVPNQFTCRVTCIYQRVICGIPIPFLTTTLPGVCKVVDINIL